MPELTIAERVAAGAVWLDRELPDWPHRINLHTLRLNDACSCILGQTFGDYGAAPLDGNEAYDQCYSPTRDYDMEAAALGFQSIQVAECGSGRGLLDRAKRDVEYDALQVEWTRVVSERLRAVSHA